MADNWKDNAQQLVYGIINPFIKLLIKIGITPNMITFAGLILNILASIVLIYGAEKGERMDHGFVGMAGFIILLGGLMDMIDGRLARVANMSSDYGALFDSVLDRYSEMFMFLGICYYLVSYDYFLSSIFAFIAMIGSVMVSYTRARAEGLGVSASVGIMQRPERILLIGIAAIACGLFSEMYGGEFKIDIEGLPFPLFETITIFTLPIFILSIMANVTAIRRLMHARKIILKSE
ncbi:MAG: CDP-alcohol phosphatidyltransferase family protein [Bacteroidota bacterium]